MLDQAYPAALATMANAMRPGSAVTQEALRGAALIIDKYERRQKGCVSEPNGAGRVRLTKDGGAALKTWAKRNSVTLVELAEVLGDGAHAMTATRAMKGEAFLVPLQVARVVAYARGELTAEMLVGAARAPGVPALPMREAPSVESKTVDRPAAETLAEDDDKPLSYEEIQRLGRLGMDRLRQIVSDEGSTTTGATAAANYLARLAMAAEVQRREQEKGNNVRDVDVLEKLQTLLFNARGQWERARPNDSQATESKQQDAVVAKQV